MRCMFWMVFLALGCSGAGTDAEHSGGEEGGDPKKAELLVNEARNQMESEGFDKARELLAQAIRYSNADIRQTIGRVSEELDEAEADAIAKTVKATADKGQCEEAIATSVKAIEGRNETRVPALLKQRTAESQLACIAKVMAGGELPRARKLRDAAATKQALDSGTLAKVQDTVGKAVVASLRTKVGDAIQARRWKEVTDKLHEAVAKGDAGASDRAAFLADVRKGVEEDVTKLVAESFGQPDAASALAKVDEMLAAGYWKARPEEAIGDEPLDKEQARLNRVLSGGGDDTPAAVGDVPTDPMPEKLHRLRRELAFWVGCDDVKCKDTTPTRVWTFGKPTLAQSHAPKQETPRKLDHGRAVWRIAEGGGLSLIATREPKRLEGLAARAHVGVGWIASAALKTEDTTEWLPPGAAVVGARVWGPLHDGAKELELGKAIGVEGAQIQVQRLSDHGVVTLARGQLHFGLTKAGTKVLAMCGGVKFAPARIASVVEPKHESLGDPRAKLECLDDQGKVVKTYEDPLGALRTKREWLPAQR